LPDFTDVSKTLGIHLDYQADVFKISTTTLSDYSAMIKRMITSDVAKKFEALG